MQNIKIAIIGLGYVGLPLARLFATKYPVIGFDTKQKRVSQIMSGIDETLEVSQDILEQVLTPTPPAENETGLYCSCRMEDLKDCNIYIVTVPTPVDKYNRPDLTPLLKASETVGKVIGQWQDRDESRRMRKLRRETSIISITSFSRNGKFPRIYGDWDEDTELFCIFLRRRRRTNREQDRTALRKDSWRESREDHHGNRTGIFTGNFHRIIYDP